jgi:RNA polymerase sigma factor (sigma-70 family)
VTSKIDETAFACENPDTVFLEELETIDRTIRSACRRASLYDADAEDFASHVKLKLIENDYAIIRKCEQRTTFASYTSVVVQRLLLDYRVAQWGKWHSSAEAKRLGEPAVALEIMVYRDGRTLDEVLPVLRWRWPHITREDVEGIAARLPRRVPRPRLVDLDAATDAADGAADDAASASARLVLARRIAAIIRATLPELDEHARRVFLLRFEMGMSTAEISRVLGCKQKPLYRVLQRALTFLRKRLEIGGITAADAEEILSSAVDLDFGFTAAWPTSDCGSTDRET